MKTATTTKSVAELLEAIHGDSCGVYGSRKSPPTMPTPPDLPPGFVRRPVIPIFLLIVALFGGIVWKLLHDLQ